MHCLHSILHSCGGQKCFNTAQMVNFTQALVTKIREVDSVRPVSSGFSMPRSDAWHMEHCPAPTTCDVAGACGSSKFDLLVAAIDH